MEEGGVADSVDMLHVVISNHTSSSYGLNKNYSVPGSSLPCGFCSHLYLIIKLHTSADHPISDSLYQIDDSSLDAKFKQSRYHT